MSDYEMAASQEFGELGELGESGEFGEFGELGASEEEEELLGNLLGGAGEMGSGLGEAQEEELASELLGVSSEEELDQFLGNVFKKVVRGVGTFVRSPVGRALGGVLKSVAKKALPVVGGALGSMVAPGIGTALGTKLGSLASGLFEVQTEEMPQEQAEYEVARRVVRLAAASARHAAAARPRVAVNPRTLARAAVARAARRYVPGIYRGMVRQLRGTAAVPTRPPVYRPRPAAPYGVAPQVIEPPPDYGAQAPFPADGAAPYAPYPNAPYSAEPAGVAIGAPQGGRWIRRGRKIIVLGV